MDLKVDFCGFKSLHRYLSISIKYIFYLKTFVNIYEVYNNFK